MHTVLRCNWVTWLRDWTESNPLSVKAFLLSTLHLILSKAECKIAALKMLLDDNLYWLQIFLIVIIGQSFCLADRKEFHSKFINNSWSCIIMKFIQAYIIPLSMLLRGFNRNLFVYLCISFLWGFSPLTFIVHAWKTVSKPLVMLLVTAIQVLLLLTPVSTCS